MQEISANYLLLRMLEQLTSLPVVNKLGVEKRAAIVKALVEGNSVRATARLTRTAKVTVLKLLVEMGEFCSIYQDHMLRDLPSKRIQCDEIWAFCGAKQKKAKQEGHGDIWTWTAIDADTKLIVSWLVGQRTGTACGEFLKDLASRLANRIQRTTDGLNWYITAAENAFGWAGVDFAQLVKTYATFQDVSNQRRYSPAECTGAIKTPIFGSPDSDHISTSFVERSNLSMRMGMRRFTRLTNAFSKKAENHAHAVSFYFMFYNYCRPHQTLTKAANGIKTTPAIASGLTNHVWTVEEILDLMRPDYLLHSK